MDCFFPQGYVLVLLGRGQLAKPFKASRHPFPLSNTAWLLILSSEHKEVQVTDEEIN